MTRACYILAFPAFSPDAAARIDDFRALHDREKRALIAPHVTLVFPHAGLGSPESSAHMRAAAARTSPIRGVLTSVLPWPDGEETLIFLGPDEGYLELMMLHTRLTPDTGTTPAGLAHVYRPHVTIGRTKGPCAAEILCEEFYGRGFSLPFTVEDIVMVSVEGDTVRELERCRLAG